MLYDPKHEKPIDWLEDELRLATSVTPQLLSDVIANASTRLPAFGAAIKTRINRLTESGAWTDATLALLELELPQWKLRRLVHDDGEWFCTLSRHPALPLELDETVEANHPVLLLAILIALLEARRSASAPSSAAVPQIRPSQGYAVCCDNFR
jgi:hypothetical protein